MLETLLREGFAYHDTESVRFAGELEAAAAAPIEAHLWSPFLHVSNHTIGEHLADWPRARALAERVLAHAEPDSETAMAWGRLSVARYLAGDLAGAVSAELDCLRAAGDDFRAAYVEARTLLAIAMIGSKRTSEAAVIYAGALAFARALPSSPANRAVAIASNNLATDLLEAANRSSAEDELMQVAADTAFEFWRRCGTWQNEERACYLKALVANARGAPGEGRTFADQALAIIEANGEARIDVVFTRLARANSFAQLGDIEAHRRDLAFAEATAATWDKPGLKSWFAEERAKIKTL